MKTFLWIAFGVTAAISLLVRLAPTRPELWHIDPISAPDPGRGGFRTEVTVPGPPGQVLDTLVKITGTYPRTRVYAGDAPSGRVTFVSHTALMGFPDYTTISAEGVDGGTRLVFLGRLRFGRSDFGVNKRRILGWIKALQSVQQ